MFRLFTRLLTVAIVLCTIFSACSKEESVQLEVSTTKLEITGPNLFFNVTSNTSWTLSQSGNYAFSVAPTSGIAGTTAVSIAYSPNTSEQERNSTLSITAGGISKSVSLTQSMIEFALNPTPLEFDATESTKSITVTANTPWDIDGITIPAWIKSVTAVNKTGNGEIKITVKENTSRISANTWLLRVNYAGSLSKSVEVIQAAAKNIPPTKPVIQTPANNATDVSVMPTFSWTASTDEEGDEINYYVQLSKDGTNWERFSAQKTTTAALPNGYGILDPNTKYYYKVTADDGYNMGTTDSDICTFTTSEKDAYADGDYTLYLESKKEKPFILIFTGDGYLVEDFKYGGLFDQNVNEAIEAFFDIEPYKSYKEYFSVYKIAAYSNEAGMSNKSTNDIKDTKFRCEWEGGNSTSVGVPNNGAAVFEWCEKIPEVANNGFLNTAIGIVINENVYAGTCLMFSNGKSISMVPYKQSATSGQTKFANTLRHEMGGHGFGRLADEYRYYDSTLPDSEKESILAWQEYGAWKNISVYPAMSDSPWAHFEGQSGYTHVGMYEGGFLYQIGVWRPETISCMEDNRAYFNSPSRFYIVKRILESSGEVNPIVKTDSDEVKAEKMRILMEKFIAKDVEKTDNSSASSNTKGGWNGVPYDFIPLAPPIMIVE